MKRKIIRVLLALVLVLSFSLMTAVPVAAVADPTNTIESSTMIFQGTLSDAGGGVFTGQIDMVDESALSLGDSIAGFDVYARVGGEAYVMDYYGTGDWNGPGGLDTYIIGPNHDAYGEAGPWGPWYDPDCADWNQFSLELTADHWYLRYTATSESPMSGVMDWNAMYAEETDKGTCDPEDDGLGPYEVYDAGGPHMWDWDAGAQVERIPLAVRGFDVEITEASGVYTVTMTPNNHPTSVVIERTGEGYSAIQPAINAAIANDIINVALGTYEEDLTIPVGKENLELIGATDAIIEGVSLSEWGETTLPNIDVRADEAEIHGFTIQGPEPSGTLFAAGMIIGAQDVEIHHNAFEVNNASDTTNLDDVSQGIVTYNKRAVLGVDVSGLYIHDNTFTHLGTGPIGYEGIYINRDEGTGPITIEDNIFTGAIIRGITVERSNATIGPNNSLTPTAASYAWTGVLVMDFGGFLDEGCEDQDNIDIIGNTIKGFDNGIKVGPSDQSQVLTNISITNNTIQGNDKGVWVRSSADGVVVNYNDISGNPGGATGVVNIDEANILNAEYNWWGGVAGPEHTSNPYYDEAETAGNDSVSNNVDFLPWMIHTELVADWNIYSTPIAPGASSNTIVKALDLWGDDTVSLDIGWYFNGATQAWVLVTGTTPLRPMQAVYLKMTAAATIDVAVSAEYSSPPQAVMSAGWNLIGPAALKKMQVDDALQSALYGAGATGLWGYSQVNSPALHQTLWTFQRVGDSTANKYLKPTEGYWVHMLNPGLLAGWTATPIEP